MVKLEMDVAGLPNNEVEMVNPDFALVAQAMGFIGLTVRHPDSLRSTLEKAFAQSGPVLVNVLTNPESLAMPPKLEFDQVKGYALSMSRLILGGRMDEVLEMVKSNYKHLGEYL
jgi:pyruvate dehydrogenase (quinone)